MCVYVALHIYIASLKKNTVNQKMKNTLPTWGDQRPLAKRMLDRECIGPGANVYKACFFFFKDKFKFIYQLNETISIKN